MTTTFNPSDKSATVTLSNGNLTATSSTAVSQSVRSTTSKSSGKVYWEVTIGTTTNDIANGIANATEALNVSGGIGADANAAGFYCVSPPQALYCNGTQFYAGTTASTTGEVIKFAVNFGTSPPTAWVLDSKMTGWNDSGTANPGTSTGGQSLTGIGSGPYYAIFNDDLGGASATINFGATAFSGTIPTGFASWDLASTTGTIAATVKRPTASLSGQLNESGTISATIKKPTASLAGKLNETGTISATVKKPTASLNGLLNESSTIAATAKKPTANFNGTSGSTVTGTISATAKKSTANFNGTLNETGTISATVKKPTASLNGTSSSNSVTGTIAAIAKKPTASLGGQLTETGTITATVKKPVATFNCTVPYVAPVGGGGDGSSDPDIARAAMLNRTRRHKIQDKRKIRGNKSAPIGHDAEPVITEPLSTIGLDTFKDALAEQAAYQAMMADEDDVAAILAMA